MNSGSAWHTKLLYPDTPKIKVSALSFSSPVALEDTRLKQYPWTGAEEAGTGRDDGQSSRTKGNCVTVNRGFGRAKESAGGEAGEERNK